MAEALARPTAAELWHWYDEMGETCAVIARTRITPSCSPQTVRQWLLNDGRRLRPPPKGNPLSPWHRDTLVRDAVEPWRGVDSLARNDPWRGRR